MRKAVCGAPSYLRRVPNKKFRVFLWSGFFPFLEARSVVIRRPSRGVGPENNSISQPLREKSGKHAFPPDSPEVTRALGDVARFAFSFPFFLSPWRVLPFDHVWGRLRVPSLLPPCILRSPFPTWAAARSSIFVLPFRCASSLWFSRAFLASA